MRVASSLFPTPPNYRKEGHSIRETKPYFLVRFGYLSLRGNMHIHVQSQITATLCMRMNLSGSYVDFAI